MITASRLCKHYGTEEHQVSALADLDFQVASGEQIAILGRSGSGKSTLLNLLGGLDRPSSGKLTVYGNELVTLSRQQMSEYRRNSVGIVFQSFQLISQRTASQNVELPLIFAGKTTKERRRLSDEWLSRVGLEQRAHHFPYQLSGGEQQRVAIARALVNRPLMVLADEPTGNLDTLTSKTVMELLKEICEQSTVTLVLVTHDQQIAKQYADRVIEMQDGRLVEFHP